MKIKDFTKGFLLAALLSSALINAGTLIDGIYKFAAGEIISATEMNHNFQIVGGNVIVDATNTTPITSQVSSPVQQCENAATDCNAGYVEFGNETAGLIESRTDPSAVINSATGTGAMSFVTIPKDGFYEISVISDPTYTVSPPDENYEQTNLNIHFAVVKFDSLNGSAGLITSNPSAMKTPRIDGSEIYSDVQTSSYVSRGDSDGNATEDYFTETIKAGAKNQLYLKANDGLAVFYWIYWTNYYAPVATDEVSFPVGSVRFRVKEVVN